MKQTRRGWFVLIAALFGIKPVTDVPLVVTEITDDSFTLTTSTLWRVPRVSNPGGVFSRNGDQDIGSGHSAVIFDLVWSVEKPHPDATEV